MKRFLSILLIMLLIASALVSCKGKNKIDGSLGLEYELNIDGSGYCVKGIGTCTDTNIVIPSTYDGLPVTYLGYEAFKDCDLIESVVIPSSVTGIGDYAFKGCVSLEDIEIPYSVTSVGAYAFGDCTSLTSITIPYTVTSIGAWAFDDCISLTDVHYTGNIEMWLEIKFYPYNSNPMRYATNLYFDEELVTSITIPDTITSIGTHALEGMTSLTDLVIPDSVTSIGELAFWGCTSLESITIPSSVTNIGQLAFSACTSLRTITFEGTTEQWISMEKGIYWDEYIPATEVVCTDGTVSLK